MKTLQERYENATNLNRYGEDGSLYLQAVCSDSELAELQAAYPRSAMVKEAIFTKEVLARAAAKATK
jgi:hypothetical protein